MDMHSEATSPIQETTNHTPKCVWMLAGVVDYKLCDLEYDCERCPFDRVIQSGTQRVNETVDIRNCGFDEQPGRLGAVRSGPDSYYLPPALFYHPAHVWARVEDGGRIRAGLDDFAQMLIGRIYSVTLPEDDSRVGPGEACWRVAHQAGETALLSPVSGKIVHTNQKLVQSPSLINRDPYGDGWALVIEPSDLERGLKPLLYGQQAQSWNQSEVDKFQRTANDLLNTSSAGAGETLQDGGLQRDFMSELNGEQLRRLISSFFPVSPGNRELNRDNAILKLKGR
ncbi:MAG TPA: glycine cleavage system protein H [Blastocatellia bacterium]|nr:glycine cleavage system protein H [Blastocatellia bacterium]